MINQTRKAWLTYTFKKYLDWLQTSFICLQNKRKLEYFASEVFLTLKDHYCYPVRLHIFSIRHRIFFNN